MNTVKIHNEINKVDTELKISKSSYWADTDQLSDNLPFISIIVLLGSLTMMVVTLKLAKKKQARQEISSPPSARFNRRDFSPVPGTEPEARLIFHSPRSSGVGSLPLSDRVQSIVEHAVDSDLTRPLTNAEQQALNIARHSYREPLPSTSQVMHEQDVVLGIREQREIRLD